MGIVGGGAYAEAVVVDEREALAIPHGLGFEEAAAIPEAFLTAHDALFTLLDLGAGEDLLIHAVGSGVGLAALQLARVAGARVLGTSRSGWKLERAVELGLDIAIDSESASFDDVVLRETGGKGVTAILDLVGGGYLAGNLRALATRGRVAVVGLVAGRTAELDLGLLLQKRLTLIGTVLRSRTLEEKIAVAEAFSETALPLFTSGRLRPVLDRVYPFAEVGAAHEYMEGDRNFGKVVLRWEG
jgi:NADPH:quinone reductase-like Zn-dependent oxidoreductase